MRQWIMLSVLITCAATLNHGCLAVPDGSLTDDSDDDDLIGGGAVGGGRVAAGRAARVDGKFLDLSPNHLRLFNGEVEGLAAGGVRRFLGIPYARPPVGDLRWQAPEEPDSWTEVKQVNTYGKRCAQRMSAQYDNAATSLDEDCLYMNVWTPEKAERSKLPVMVWIHGGGHTHGSASEPAPDVSGVSYSGAGLAEKGVVVASFNYRLGALGFLAHDALKSEHGHVYGNQGLWDQTFALQWIHDNIETFGGDPNNVTLFGEGSGATDVCYHMVSPMSRGLFQQAIGESGGCATYQPTAQETAEATRRWASQLGCVGEDALDCLRQRPVEQLLDAAPDDALTFAPVVDGKFLRDQPRALFDDGEVADAAYILGSNAADGERYQTTYDHVSSDEAFRGLVQREFPDASPADLASAYLSPSTDAAPTPSWQNGLSRMFRDARVTCPTLDTAARAAAAGITTYVYSFDASADPGAAAAKAYGAEVPYVFGAGNLPEDQRALSALIQKYWTNFATFGDPNDATSSSAWPLYSAGADTQLDLSSNKHAQSATREPGCELWNQLYARPFERAGK